MKDRRSLLDGITVAEGIDPDLAEEFIYQGKPPAAAKAAVAVADAPQTATTATPTLPASLRPMPVAEAAASSPLTGVGRVPVGARVRTELAAALKRASLERQLQGVQPNSVQDILEESLELWLHKHGLLR